MSTMEEKKSMDGIGKMMQETMEHIHAMADVNTVVGAPIATGDVTLIPVSRVSAAFGCGGTDFGTKAKPEKDGFGGGGGGGGAGVTIDPMAFLIVRGDSVRLMPILPPANGAVDRAVELLPEVMDKITDFLDKRKEKKDIEDI